MAPPKGQPKYERSVFNARFWARVNIKGPDDCWIWNGAKDSNGYGTVRYNSKFYGAHRFAYACTHGDESIKGWDILHSCDVPLCCNPSHHFRGDQTDNNKDRDSKKRNARHARHGKAKLLASDIEEIRRLAKKPYWGFQTRMAERFGIATSGVNRIISGELWKDDAEKH
jgi:hypothetical protein